VALLDKLNRDDVGAQGSLEAAFISTSIGQLVAEAVDSSRQAQNNFIMDLVQIKVGAKMTGLVLNTICEAVFKWAKHIKVATLQNEISADDEAETPEVTMLGLSRANICLSPVDVYEAVLAVLPRLHLCVRVISLVPDVVKKLKEDTQSQKAFNLDMCILEEVVDMMNPKGSDMLEGKIRHDWASRVTSLSTLLKQLEGLVSREPVAAEDQARMEVISRKCQRLEMVKLFLDHMFEPDVNILLQETVCNNLRSIFSALKDPDFLTGLQTFNNLRHAIQNYDRKGGVALLGFKDIQECVICLEAIKEPVILPCSHSGCSDCFREALQADTEARICPKNGCKAPIPEDFKFQSDAKMGLAAAEHANFRRKLSQFFIEMVQRFVFVKGKIPHQVHIHTHALSIE